MHQGSTPITTQRTTEPGERLAALHPVVPVAQPASGANAPAVGARPGTKALLVGGDTRALEVHYELDRVANVWVAHIIDAGTGELVRQTPSTRVLHQLAELTHAPRVDRRA